jgi:hypothetical protein
MHIIPLYFLKTLRELERKYDFELEFHIKYANINFLAMKETF